MKKDKPIPCLSDTGCKGTLSLKKIEHRLKHNGKTIIVPDVTVWECDTCHERFYPQEASQRIDLYKECSGKLMLRIDPLLHQRLARLAQEHHRSLNQEIAFILSTATRQ